MFTGIIEQVATVYRLEYENTNLHIWLQSLIAPQLKIDQSVAHNGVCLTVVAIDNNIYKVSAVAETLNRTNLAQLQVGAIVNIERCMTLNTRVDGHMVQGHVDTIATVTKIEDVNGSWNFFFAHAPQSLPLTVTKGSIAVNGVSLTVVHSTMDSFSVTIIPYTYEHTNFCHLMVGDEVNIEFDIIGKYIARMLPYAITAK